MSASSFILKDSLSAIIVRGLGIVLTFTSTTIAARCLGAAEYGRFASALALSTLFAALAPLGTDRVLAKTLSITSDRKSAAIELAVTLYGTLFVAFGLVVILICLALSMHLWWPDTELLTPIACAVLMFVPLTLLYLRQWAAIPLIGTRRALQLDQVLVPFLFAASLVTLVSTSFRPTAIQTAAVYAACVAIALGTSFCSGTLRSLYQDSIRSLPALPPGLAKMRLAQGLPFAAVSIGGVISQTCMPVMIAVSCGFQEAGYFGIAASYGAIPLIPLGVLNLSLIPLCSRHYQNGRGLDAEHAVRSAATVTFYLGIATATAVWLSSALFTTLLGVEYTAVVGLLPPLLLAAIADCLTGPTVPVMQSMGLERFYTRAILMFVPCQLIVVSLAGNYTGVRGAAVAYLAARCVWNLIVGLRIHRSLGLRMLPYKNPFALVSSFGKKSCLHVFPAESDMHSSEHALRQGARAA